MGDKYNLQLLQEAITLIEFLSGREAHFLGPAEIAEATGISQNKAFRILVNLEGRGWVETRDGRYRLAPGLIRISENYRLSLVERAAALDAERERFLVSAYHARRGVPAAIINEVSDMLFSDKFTEEQLKHDPLTEKSKLFEDSPGAGGSSDPGEDSSLNPVDFSPDTNSPTNSTPSTRKEDQDDPNTAK